MVQTVKNLNAMQETEAQALGQEDPWRKWRSTQGFLPEESLELKSLMCYSSEGHKESDMTEAT